MSWSYDCFYMNEWHRNFCPRFLTQEEIVNYVKDETCPIRFVETNERPTHSYIDNQLKEIPRFGFTREERRKVSFIAWLVIVTTISSHGFALPLWVIVAAGYFFSSKSKEVHNV
jgi:hypothetical protein